MTAWIRRLFAPRVRSGDAPCGWPYSKHPNGVCPLEGEI